jgi:transposase
MEQPNYNLLFRWFVGLNMDDSVWDVTVFTKNGSAHLLHRPPLPLAVGRC